MSHAAILMRRAADVHGRTAADHGRDHQQLGPFALGAHEQQGDHQERHRDSQAEQRSADQSGVVVEIVSPFQFDDRRAPGNEGRIGGAIKTTAAVCHTAVTRMSCLTLPSPFTAPGHANGALAVHAADPFDARPRKD
jgi:hypothetical protein